MSERTFTITEDELRKLTCAQWGEADIDGPVLEGLAFATADELRLVLARAFEQRDECGEDPISAVETQLLRIAERLEASALIVRRARRGAERAARKAVRRG